MNIKFDFELNPENDDKKLSPIFIGILEEIRKYFEGRLSVFSETMLKNETYFGSFVLINICAEPLFNIAFVKYAPSLTDKMKATITEDDYKYLNRILRDVVDSFLN